MNPKTHLKLLLLALLAVMLTTCEKPERDNLWDNNTNIDPSTWAPENLNIETLSITERKLTWDYADHDIAGFKIDRKQGEEDWLIALATLTKETHQWNDTTLLPDTAFIYEYRLYAYAGNNNSKSITASTNIIFPPPSNLNITKLSDVSYKLQWQDNATGEQGFKIDRKRDDEDWQLAYGIVPANHTHFVDSNVFTGKSQLNVQYRLYAFYETYETPKLQIATQALLPAPTDLIITSNSITSLTLNWTVNSAGHDGFRIERRHSGASWQELAFTTDPNYKDETFDLNTTVHYRVCAVAGDFSSDFSANSFNTNIPPPTNLQIIQNTIISVTLNWADNSIGEEGFKIERSYEGGNWNEIATTKTNSYDDNTFDLNTQVYYRVSAYVSQYQSSFAENSFNSQIPAPVNLNFIVSSYTSVTLSWEYNALGHEGFKLERRTNEGEWNTIAPNINPEVLNFTDTQINLEQNNYTYRLSAFARSTDSEHTVIDLSLPTVTTGQITNIQTNSATGGGNVTNQGGTPVTARGVCWSTSPNPTIADSHTIDGSGTGPFTSNLTGLSPATIYYVRAYATNTAGTSYGTQVEFITDAGNTPTVTTAPITNIQANSATGGGYVTNQGATQVTARGVCWSTTPNPNIADSHTVDGSGTGTFTSNLTGLTPATTYYVRAYATNAAGTAYGTQRVFTTMVDYCAGVTPPPGFGVVSSSGKCWFDRNLGASRVAQSSTDAQAYGDLYQWGRLTDGHQNRTSGTTSTLSNGDVPGHGNFILTTNSPYDWRSPQNNNLWQGVSGTNNPCPAGYRLPTQIEWEAERQSWSSSNAAGAFNSPLKLPLAGDRYYIDGSIYDVGSYGTYWSATVDHTAARRLRFWSSGSNTGNYSRAFGLSVRCIKD